MYALQRDLTARLKMAGIIAHLPQNLPLQSITTVTDALLASPIQAVQISYEDENSLHLINDLAQRSHGLLTIGVRVDERWETAVSIPSFLHAGANYITSPRYDSELHEQCFAQKIVYIPGAISALTAQVFFHKKVTLMQLYTGGPDGSHFVAAINQATPHMAILIDGDLPTEFIADYAKSGGTAVIVQSALFTHRQQTMADIITRARTLQNAWHNGVSGF